MRHNSHDNLSMPLAASDPDGGSIGSLVDTSRRWLRSGWVATGAAISIGLFVSLLLVAGLLDLAIVLWPALRFVGLMTIVVPTAWALLWGVARPLLRRVSRRAVARRIEAELPGIHNRLVSCVDLEAEAQANSVSASFYKKLVGEAEARIQGFHPHTLLDRGHLTRAGVFAGTSLLAFVIGLQVFSDRLPTALARIFSPFADIPPASGVVYRVEPGDHKILRGDEFDVTVTIDKGTADDLTIEVDVTEGENEGQSLRYDLVSQSDTVWHFHIPTVSSSFDYRVRGGGTWSPAYRVNVLDRPHIVGLQTKLIYPSYLGSVPAVVGPPDVADVSGPDGSTVSIEVIVDGDSTAGHIELLQSRVKSVPLAERPERTWLSREIPEGAAAEGMWDWIDDHHGRAAHRHSAAVGQTSHQFVNAPVGFRVRPDEVLFADVFLDAANPPVAIMLQYQDSSSWEHRAFWGSDVFAVGQSDRVGRFRAGDLPPAGRWVRLEVPASLLELEGHSLHGISFTQFGGSAWWGNAGTLPPASRQVEELVVVDTAPLKFAGRVASPPAAMPQQMGSGSFPLNRNGWYRIELRNEIGAANLTMKAAQLTAIPDRPPQVFVERPGVDLLLSTPQTVPLSIAAFDDFGLADLVLAIKRNDADVFSKRPIKQYDSPTKADATLVALDIAAENMTEGDVLRYRIEARDLKGQSAETQEFTIRIQSDSQAADQQLADVEKSEDTFRQQLAKLVHEQAAVQRELVQLEAKHKPLSKKLTTAPPTADDPMPNDSPQPPTPELDDAEKQQLSDLKTELAALQQHERRNAETARQLNDVIEALANEVGQQPLLPREIQEEMQRVADSFSQLAVDPLEALNAKMQASAAPESNDPALTDLINQGERIARNLDALQNRMDAIAAAQQQAKQDILAAMEVFQRELTRQNARLSADELADLRDKIDDMRSAIQDLLGRQEELVDAVPQARESQMQELTGMQEQLDERIDDSLADVRRLLNTDEFRRLKQQQNTNNTGDEPNTPSPNENMEANDGETPEPQFQPALGGPHPKVDPKFSDDPPKVASKSESPAAGTTMQMELARHQRKQARMLSQAEQSLGSDQQKIEQLLHDLVSRLADAEKNARNQDIEANPGESPNLNDVEPATEDASQLNLPFEEALSRLAAEHAAALAEVLASQMMKQAMAMAARSRQHDREARQRPGAPRSPSTTQPEPGQSPEGNLLGTLPGEQMLQIELLNLDPGSRSVILDMQPAQREEILQGLPEEGPEGYREYIRDYFKRLTKVKAGSPSP